MEGNNDINPFFGILDTACPKTVAGRVWLDSYVESLGMGHAPIKQRVENEKFKFGPSETYTSNMSYQIHVEMGNLKENIFVSIVEANIPLLIGIDYQSEWGMIFDTQKKEVFIRKSKESFTVNTSRGNHWKMPIRSKQSFVMKQTIWCSKLTWSLNLTKS